jgi:hypothetical protein
MHVPKRGTIDSLKNADRGKPPHETREPQPWRSSPSVDRSFTA